MGVVNLDAAMCDIFFEVEVISERFKVESKSVVNFLEQSAIDYSQYMLLRHYPRHICEYICERIISLIVLLALNSKIVSVFSHSDLITVSNSVS